MAKSCANLVDVKLSWQTPAALLEGRPGVEQIRASAIQVYSVAFSSVNVNNGIYATGANDGTVAVPGLGASWGALAPYLTCMRVRIESPVNPYLYKVIAEFAGQTSPLTQPPIVSEDGEEHVEEVYYDAMGQPYINSAGQWSTMPRPFCDKVFLITRNEPTDSFVGGDWRNVVNTDTVNLGQWSWGPKKVLLRNISAPRQPGPAGAITSLATVSSVIYAGGVYTINLTSGNGPPNGGVIGVTDTNGNSISGTVSSGGGTGSLVLSSSGLVITGSPTSIPSGTLISWTAAWTNLTYFWPVTYRLVVRTNSVAYNGGSATDIGWQSLIPNKGDRYRPSSGAVSVPAWQAPWFMSEVSLNSDGTLIKPGTETALNVTYFLRQKYLPVVFASLALSM